MTPDHEAYERAYQRALEEITVEAADLGWWLRQLEDPSVKAYVAVLLHRARDEEEPEPARRYLIESVARRRASDCLRLPPVPFPHVKKCEPSSRWEWKT